MKILYGIIFVFLWLACVLLFAKIRWLEWMDHFLKKSREGMEAASRKRLLENRRQLLTLQKTHSFWYRLEQELNYSGLKRWFPLLSAEMWLVGNVVGISGIAIVLLMGWGWKYMFAGLAGFIGLESIFLYICKARAFRSVNANLIKFLDFLGNYSITAGEITSIFTQLSKYMEEPLKTVLEECSNEAKTTGDASLALLSMAEKVEHPKFKELVRNMEISVRYCADFSLLVQNSRRMMREYLRLGEERKGLLREAVINMSLLLGMAVVALWVVDGLLETSVWSILFGSVPGRIALGVVGIILCLFAGKLMERR